VKRGTVNHHVQASCGPVLSSADAGSSAVAGATRRSTSCAAVSPDAGVLATVHG
jgi:hypothetical protein